MFINLRPLSLTHSFSLFLSLFLQRQVDSKQQKEVPEIAERISLQFTPHYTHLARTMGVARLARMMALAALLLQLNHVDAYSSTYTPCCTLSIVFVSFVLSLLCPFCNFQSVRSIAPPLSLCFSLFLFFFLSLSISLSISIHLCVYSK